MCGGGGGVSVWTKDPETWRAFRWLPDRVATAVICRLPTERAGQLRYSWEVLDCGAIVAHGEASWFDEAKDRAWHALKEAS